MKNLRESVKSAVKTPNSVKNPALRYYGGKFRLGRWIASHFPPHVTYVEPFGGAAGVLLRKEPSAIEVYNDIDGMVFNFFRVLRDHRRDLLQKLKRTPFSRAEFDQSFLQDAPDPVENARRYFVQAWQSFGGPRLHKITGWKHQKSLWLNSRVNQVDEWRQALRNVSSVAARFARVQLEHCDALQIFARYDTSETLFYCDPPYPSDTRNASWMKNAYTHEFTAQDHVHLANALKRIQGLALISTYPNDHYKALFSDWPSVTTTCQTMNKTIATEQLYISPRAWELLKLPSA